MFQIGQSSFTTGLAQCSSLDDYFSGATSLAFLIIPLTPRFLIVEVLRHLTNIECHNLLCRTCSAVLLSAGHKHQNVEY